MNSDKFEAGSSTPRPNYKLKLYWLGGEYCGTITTEMGRETKPTSFFFNTIIVFDSSGSMGDSVGRFINKVFPLLFSKLNYELSSRIHLIAFERGKAHCYSPRVESFKNLTISSGGRTYMAPAVAALQCVFEAMKNHSQHKAVRLLTITDGLVRDPQQVKSGAQKLVEFLSRESFKVNSQAVRFIINHSQPDTEAIASLLLLNNTIETNLINVYDSESSDVIATKIANLFASDSFEKIIEQKTLSAELDILNHFPGDVISTSNITLLPGENTLWLKEFPAKGLKINKTPVTIDQQPPLTLVTFQALMENVMGSLINRIKILKIVGTQEADNSLKKMINYFEKHPKKIMKKLKAVAGDDVSKLNNEQKAEYLRRKGNSKKAGDQVAVLAPLAQEIQQFQEIRPGRDSIKSTLAELASRKSRKQE